MDPDRAPPPPYSAAVLAGGRSSRFGADKARALLAGRPLLAHAAASLPAPAELLLVAARPYPDLAALVGARQVRDAGGAPLAGVAAALAEARWPWLAVVACDLPHLTPDFWRLLLARTAGARAVAVRHEDGRWEPLAALYHRDALAVAEARLARGERSLQGLLGAVGARAVPAAEALRAAGPRALSDVDRPEDLRPAGD